MTGSVQERTQQAKAPVVLNCNFLVATTSANPYEICLQAEEQSGPYLHVWVITDAEGNNWYGYEADFCQEWATNPGPLTIEHILIDPVTSLFESCSQEVEIYPPVVGKSCPDTIPIVSVDVANDCSLETTISLDLSDIGIPFVASFGDGSPAISANSSPLVHQYPWGGVFELALTFNPPPFSDNNPDLLSTCRYDISVTAPPNCSGDCLPNRISVETSGPCPWENVALFFNLSPNILPLQVEFGDGTGDSITSLEVVHSFPAPGTYIVSYSFTTPQGYINTCYETVEIPDCCSNPSFTFEQYPGSPSCLNPLYILYPHCNQDGSIHKWIFSDSTVFEGPIPPPHIFTNFVDENGEVCVIHELACCENTYRDTLCLPHPPGAYIGDPQSITRLSDILPFTGGTVLEFIQQHMNNPNYPLFIEGELIADIDADFGAGTWNMGEDAVVLVAGESCGITEQAPPYRFFALRSTTLQSAAALDPKYIECCNWQGVKSGGATFIVMDSAAIRECQIGLHYLPPREFNCFPYAYIRNSTFFSNNFGIKSEGQYVHFLTPAPFFLTGFSNNRFFGAPQEALCTCNAENAIDFRDVRPFSLTIKLLNGFSTDTLHNEIARYEQGLHFENTSLEAKGFYIHDLGNFAPPGDPPSLYDPEAGFGIWYSWRSPAVPSKLWIDNFRFENFYVNQGPAIAVYDAVYSGKHSLKAVANQPYTSIRTDNLAGGYKLEVGPWATFQGEISGNDITTDGAHTHGFGILGNLASENTSLRITDNTFSVNSDPIASTLNGGIVLGSPSEMAPDLTITDNLIQVNQTNGAGIALTNLKNYIVRRNDIIGGSSDIPGIVLRKGGYGVVDCNDIQNKYTGILVEASPDNRFALNSLYGNRRDMEFKGDNLGSTGSELHWNVFSHSDDYSIFFYPDAYIGNQYHTRFNTWWGQTWTNGIPDEDVFAANENMTEKRFYFPFGASLGSEHHPNSHPTYLFIQTSIPEDPVPLGFCLTTLDEVPPRKELADGRQRWEEIVSDSVGQNLPAPLRAFLEQRAYGQILAHPDWKQESAGIADFFDQAQQGFTGHSQTLRNDWRAWTELAGSLQSQKEAQYAQTNTLASHIQTWATEAAVTADSTTADSLWALIQVGLHKLQYTETGLALEDSTIRADLLAELQQLKNENDALESTEVWQWAERRYNEIALKWLSGAAPDSADLSDLRAIAAMCLNQGGRAVLDARALCAVWLQEFYADNDACTPAMAAIQPQDTRVESAAELMLTPNPVDEALSLQLPLPASPDEPRIIEVVSSDGRILYRRQLVGEERTMCIATAQWTDGLYFVRLITARQSLIRAFVVQH